MATKRRKVRKTRRRSCKNGKLKKPVRTKSGGKRRCKKTKKRTKRKSRRKYRMKSLRELASRNIANNLEGDIDKRIETISNRKDIPYNTKIDIINQLEKDKDLISTFYEAKVSKDINENDIFIRYIRLNKNNKVKIILKYYPEYVNAIDNKGSTALIEASHKGRTEIVKMLLDKGANVNEKGVYGNTALIEASHKGRTEIVKMLLDKGADPNIQDDEGDTALMDASYNGHTEVVRILLENDADPNIKESEFGDTALIYASIGGHTKIVELLREYGATQ